MKALGSEITEFYQTGWPDGYYHDDGPEIITPDDRPALDPATRYDLREFGVLINESNPEDCVSFSSALTRWRRSQTSDLILVRVPKDRVVEFRSILKGLGVVEVKSA